MFKKYIAMPCVRFTLRQRMYDFRVRVEEKKTMYVIKLTKGQF